MIFKNTFFKDLGIYLSKKKKKKKILSENCLNRLTNICLKLKYLKNKLYMKWKAFFLHLSFMFL